MSHSVSRIIIISVLFYVAACTDDNSTDVTLPPPFLPAVQPVYPPDSSINVPLQTTLQWRQTPGASRYHLKVFLWQESFLISMNILLLDTVVVMDTSFSIDSLAMGKFYSWRVVALDETGRYSFWYDWYFKTITSCKSSSISYSGKLYHTVGLGDQCWLKENLDIGEMIDSLTDSENNGNIEKYCYRNDPERCSTYGGLYQWEEAMQYTTTAASQGICPPGWHIPTYTEYLTLDTTVGISLDNMYNEGFATLLGGARTSSGGFEGGYLDSFYSRAEFWSSTLKNADSARGVEIRTYIGIFLSTTSRPIQAGMSVRCLQN